MNSTNSFNPGRYVLLLGAAAVALAGSLLVYGVGAHADTSSSTAPVISSVIATPNNTGATVTWLTDQPSNTQVLYGQTTSYNASSTLDSTNVTSHTAFLGGLTPNTMYHFQLLSSNASGTMATSSDMTFTTTGTTTATTTVSAAPVLSTIVATPSTMGATITWMSDIAANSQVAFGTTASYGSLSTLDNTQVTNHSVMLAGLNPSTMYHFRVWSTTSSSTASSTDHTFTTSATATSTGGTGSSTLDMLQAQIDALKIRVSALEAFIAGLGSGGGTTTPPSGGTGMIDQNGSNVNTGSNIDFSGRNFGHEESVVITLNGNIITTAHADGGGNFSTGSLMGPTIAGTYMYHFVGQTSGITSNATITVH